MLSSTAVKRAAGKRTRRPIREVKPPPPEQLELDVRTAADLYDLRDHVRGELVNDSVTVLRGSSRVPGDLSLDLDDEDGCDGTIIDGDLRVRGTVVNRESERGSFLLVTGDLRARNLIAGGAEIVVLGDLIVDEVIFGYESYGSVTVHGATRAKAIITAYHAFDLRGRIEGITVSGRGRITDDDHFRSYAPALVDDVLAAGGPPGGHPDWHRTTEAILAGRPVLRQGVVLN
jgi:hypothetical protein